MDAFAKRAGTHKTSLYKWREGKGVTDKKAGEVLVSLGVPPRKRQDILNRAQGLPSLSLDAGGFPLVSRTAEETVAALNRLSERIKAGGRHHPSGEPLDVTAGDVLTFESLRPVPLYEGRVGAGPGREIQGELEGFTTVPSEEVRRTGASVALIGLRLYNMADSMEPVIPSESMVIVDRGQGRDAKSFVSGGIYAVRLEDDSLAVKYVKWDRDRFILFSHNVNAHTPVTVTWTDSLEDIIVGRVVLYYKNVSDVTAKG
ncbi:MAG: S24 family peptidase [Pseudomonadota bacterium]